jgi:aryl-alcohol dehydrogenase-like predicted oxidoreductase
LKAVEHLKQLCDERHLLLAQVAIAWVLENPTITSAITAMATIFMGNNARFDTDQTGPARRR